MKNSELRSVPSDPEAERGVIAACMDRTSNTALFQTRSILTVTDFLLDDNRRVFGCLCEMQDAGTALGAVELYHEFVRRDWVKILGGASWIVETYEGGPVYRMNLGHYLGRVRDLSLRRQVINSAQILMHDAADQTIPVEESLATFEAHSREAATPLNSEAESVGDIIDEAGGFSDFMAPTNGVTTPWGAFNAVTGGFQRGDLVIIGARPSMGKTAAMLEAARWNALQKDTPAVYSYEMSKGALVKRMLSRESHITYTQIITGDLSREDRIRLGSAAEKLKLWPIHIVGAAGKTPLWVRCHIERLRRKANLKIAYVDYLQLVPASVRSNNRNQEVGGISREFKAIATECDIPMVVLSQLSRANESRTDKRPGLSDLRDSGEIEAHADLVGFVHREEYYKRNSPELKGMAEIIIAKQRNGPVVTIDLRFAHTYGGFLNPDSGEKAA